MGTTTPTPTTTATLLAAARDAWEAEKRLRDERQREYREQDRQQFITKLHHVLRMTARNTDDLVPEGAAAIDMGDGFFLTLHRDGPGHTVLVVTGPCPVCGQTLVSEEIYDLAGLGKAMYDDAWTYHDCQPEGEPAPLDAVQNLVQAFDRLIVERFGGMG